MNKKSFRKILHIIIICISMFALVCPIFAAESDYRLVSDNSIMEWLSNPSLTEGYYRLTANGEEYDIHLYVLNGNQEITSNTSFGEEGDIASATENARHMVAVKVNGNLTISENATLTSINNSYGGPKGLTLYVTGTLTNNGSISMSSRGAKAIGENVYLYKNVNGTYETVPAVGASAKADAGVKAGTTGNAGDGRKTGSGGTGSSRYDATLTGDGSAGTSYSGGSGSGATYVSGTRTSNAGGNGGAGSSGYTSSTSTSGRVGGGAGNPGGTYNKNGVAGSNGTGGLLNIYAHEYKNNGVISANGANGGNINYGGGSSGGGSINIFIDNSPGIDQTGIITETRYYEILGNVSANGGTSVGSTQKGGAGGAGTVNIGIIRDGNYRDLWDAIEDDKKSYTNSVTISGESILSILQNENLSTGYYNFLVNDTNYPVHMYVLDGDQHFTENKVFGNSIDVATSKTDAQNMVIVKVKGSLEIDAGVNVTTYKDGLYGGPKGFFLYVTDTLKNKGTISMSSRGAKATGQNVYLWKNPDGNYEYVPAVGALGKTDVSGYPGLEGNHGDGRKTGSGGTGASRNSGTLTGRSGNGTSYSGGSGSGATSISASGTTNTGAADNNGGAGSKGNNTSTSYNVSGGAGNPGGGTDRGANGANGTGGLLNIYAHEYQNEGVISANGAESASVMYGGGSSGGGSINIFIDNKTGIDQTGIITNTRYHEILGNVSANGGVAIGTTYKGGKGGNGTVNIGEIRNGQYYDLTAIIDQEKEDYENSNTIGGESLLSILQSENLPTGYYNFNVNNEDYPVHLYNLEGDQTFSGEKIFGDEVDVATSNTESQNMIIVKINGNLTIDAGATLSTYKNEFGGPKGFFLYVTGTLTNNGTISMSSHGAKAIGQNVYLWKNPDGNYEFVPAVGASGGAGGTSRTGNPGQNGANASKRATAGGGAGASKYAGTKAGTAGAGTSYSGGVGSGATSVDGTSSVSANNYGGAGGVGRTNSTSSSYYVGGGAGNPGGRFNGGTQNVGVAGSNGTGGLLNIYAHEYKNNGLISANGANGGNAYAGGGSSGGGSINIFIDNNTGIDQTGIITDTRYNEILGNVSANGGTSVGTSYKSGKGGNGTINIGTIRRGKYYDLKEAINEDIDNFENNNTIIGDSILSILKDNDLKSGYYNFSVNGIDYPIHLYNYDESQVIVGEKIYGDETDVATSTTESQNMIIVKINGDLTVTSGATLTTFKNEFGGPKGFTVYVTGMLLNNGSISMSSRGAKATGENVYLWHNKSGSYETVPAIGAAEKIDANVQAGTHGNNGDGRKTGSGGTGASRYAATLSGKGGAGTSYSGGAGSGATSSDGKRTSDASNIGGAGSNAIIYSSTQTSGGGAGNPGGSGSANGSNGTGGLLNIYAHDYRNKGVISANGATGGNAKFGGGSSGGGSINLFIDNDTGITQTGIITDTRYYEILGNVSANGGAQIGATYNGGAGGAGTINIGKIIDGEYYDLRSAIDKDKEDFENNNSVKGDSILAILKEKDLKSGYYNFEVEGIKYPVHLYTFDRDQNWNTNQTFGDVLDVATATNDAQNMVIVKVNGNVQIGSGTTISTFKNEFGGPKGFLLYVTGTLTNNGTISADGTGAKATGENVYLWHNKSGSYEFVPAIGANGGASIVGTKPGLIGANGNSAGKRATAGGGSGAARSSGSHSGVGGVGTSYSGGTGGGANALGSGTAGSGSNNGGVGGTSQTGTSSSYKVSGGVGNPGGKVNQNGIVGANGTGGLLTIYADNYQNNGTISARGITNNTNAYGGGSSGGGSINLFINNDTGINQLGIVTETRYNEIKGFTTANGGSAAGSTKTGGAGGNGTVNIGKIIDDEYYDLHDAIDKDIEAFINGNTIEGNSILEIVSEDLNSGYYNFKVNDETYPVHLITIMGDQHFTESQTFGDALDVASGISDAQNMVIVKIIGNLEIDRDVLVTAFSNEYGGPKGFLLYVSGTLTNNGQISMSGKGAKAKGQNVYLWKNSDGTYETVPATGGAGASTVSGTVVGKTGIAGVDRSTAGGGSGASRGSSSISGAGGVGSSYSGGAGGGANTLNSGAAGAGSSSGGSGGNSKTSTSSSYTTSSGVGNPSGTGATVKSPNGTGGLLTIFANKYYNNGVVSATGITAGYANYGGGSSGGGSINIFYTAEDLIKGTTNVSGGAATGATKKGGAGGNGTVTYKEVILENELIAPTLKTLTVDKGTMSPNFESLVYEYNVILGNTDYNVNIDATVTKPGNKVTSGIGNFNIPSGKSVHQVVVTSAAGNINIYKINFERPANNIDYLNGIKINDKEIEGFDKDTLEYEIHLDYTYTEFDLSVVVGSTSQKIYGTGKVTTNSGSNTYYIDVTSEDDSKTRQYKLKVFRDHSSKLKELSLGEYTLEPSFEPEKYDYTLNILSTTMTVPVTYKTFDEEATVKTDGFGYIKSTHFATINVTEPNSEPTTYKIKIIKGNIDDIGFEYTCTKGPQIFEAPLSGKYQIELWGAQGGTGRTNNTWTKTGGLGAYTSGVITLEQGDKFYVYVGCKGNDGGKVVKYIGGVGGYNGGANGGNDTSTTESAPDPAGGGGGATDIRLIDGEWNNIESLKSRIMVAAGGGGGTYSRNGQNGGLSKNSGYAFGYGQNGFNASNGSGGGAGGYYGGKSDQASNGLGYGGTSFISGNTDFKAYNALATDQSVHESGLKFSDSKYFSGSESMPSKTTGYSNGNSGDGHARITRLEDLSSNNFLTSLIVKTKTEEKELSPEFKPEVLEYNLKLGENDTSVQVLAKQDDPKALLNGDGTFDIPAGDTDIKISVVAEDNTERIYTIHVNRPASSDAFPKNITISGLVPSLCSKNERYCKQDPSVFDKDTDTYKVIVPSKIKQVYFNVDKGHAYQTVVGDGKQDLVGGENTFTITITSEDKTNTKTYTFIIDRDMTGNNDIQNIEIIDPKYDLGFNPDITDYYMSVPNDYTKIVDMKITLDDEEASYIVSGNENFVVGDNVVTITVTAKNGDIKIYTINVYREKSGNTYLSNLSIENEDTTYSLSPEFNKVKKGIYVTTVPNDVDKITIVATPEHELTTVVGDGEKNLKSGINTFNITTTAEDGSSEIYTITITREKNNNANLTEITLTDQNNKKYSLNETFNKEDLIYTANVDEGTTKITITATTEVSTTTYTLLDNDTIVVGDNKKRILAVSEDGTSKTYEVTINRPANTNNYLESITLSSGTLTPDFDKTTNDYTLTVPNDISKITITGKPESAYASIKGNGTYSLSVGTNTITLTVTAEDKTTNDYEIVITREANSNAYLKTLTSSLGTLTPDFDKETFEYSINVENNITEVTINATPEINTTNVRGTGKIALASGNNEVKIVTLAEDGITTKTYTVNIYRDKSDNDNIRNLILKEGAISPNFDQNIVSYTAKVPYDVTDVHAIVELESPVATYTITGDTNLKVGENTVTVTVTSESGQEKPYTIIVTRQEEETANNYLQSLSVEGEDLIPEFAKENQFYTLTVPFDVTKVKVLGAAFDEFALVTGLGDYELKVGDNLVLVRVVGVDEKIRDYQILITREKSNEARLSSLVLFGSTLTPNFNKDTYRYETTTANSSLNFASIATLDPDATYEVIDNSFTAVGDYTVIIRVTAADGKTTKDYEIVTTKTPSANNNLSSLSVLDYEITPSFEKSKTNYTLTVPNNVNSLVVFATAEDDEATVTGTGNIDIEVGTNKIEVVVTSGKGTKKTYTITVTKEGDHNNLIKSLSVLNGTLHETFESTKNNYTVTVPYEQDSLSLDIVLESNTASYIIKDNKLNVGNNTVSIVVTSQNGETNIYTLNVVREEIVSALLEKLEVKNYGLTPEFDSHKKNYDVVVDYEIKSLDLTIETLDKNATYKVIGNENFEIGENTVTILVTASDKVTEETYTITVNRQSYSNTYLDYLYTSLGDVTPEFNKENLTYSIDVTNDKTEIELFAEAIDKTATVTGTGIKTLKTGDNKFNIVVKTTSGITRTYYVTVNRAKDTNNDLNSLKVLVDGVAVSMTPEFNKDTLEYFATVPTSTEEVIINAIKDSSTSKVSGAGKMNIALGENTKNIVVTAEDGSTKTYVVHITRPGSNNSNLTNLVPSNGEMTPSFMYGTTSYTLNVDSGVSNLSFTYTTEDKNAKVTGYEEQIVPDGTSIRTITVTAEDNTTTTYTVTVIKERTDNAYLSSLSVTGYTLTPEFNKETKTYYLTVPNTKTNLVSGEVIAIPEDKNARVSKDNNLALTTSSYGVYSVVVTAPDGVTTETYQIIVTREKSSISGLKSLKVLQGNLDKPFETNTLEYDFTIPKSITNVDETLITYVKNDPASTVKITPVPTVVTKNTYEFLIEVTSEDGTNVVTYTLNVAHALSNDNLLTNLVIDKGYYEPNFNSKIYEYDVYEYNSVDEITITVTKSNEFATVIGDGLLAISADEMDHTITVTAENGEVQEYILHIHRNISNEKTLKNLALEDLDKVVCDDGECVMTPKFHPDTENYAITVPNEYETLKIIADVMSEEQSVKVKIGSLEVHNDYKLPSGKTTATIEVYDGMGVLTKTYTIDITKSLSKNNNLIDLEVVDYPFDKEFNKDTLEYTVHVPEDVEEVSVTYEKEDEKATVSIDGYYNLHEGNNEILVTVTSVNGDTKVYKINCIKAAMDSSFLSNITVSSGVFYELDPDFDRETLIYKVTVPASTDKVLVEATPELATTKVEGTGEKIVKSGTTTVSIVATSPKGKVTIYKINITRDTNKNVNLKELSALEGKLSPDFEKSTVKYDMTVADTVSNLTLTIKPEEDSSTYKVIGNNNFVVGENTVSIVVYNADKTASKTYQIKVKKLPSKENTLRSLGVYETIEGERSYFELDPSFEIGTETYRVSVGDINKATIEAIPYSEKTFVIGDGEFYLEYGDNIHDITLTAEDGSISTYQVNIIRSYNLNLSEITTDIGTLSPEFNKDTLEYNVSVPKDTKEITINAKTEKDNVTITSDLGTHTLNGGDNEIDIVVTSPDGKTKTYKVIVEKELSDNNYIKELYVHEGLISPEFDKTKDTYETTVRSIFTTLGIDVTLEDDTAKYEITGNENLVVGENRITIKVTAENGDERYYYIDVNLEDDNEYSARLRNLMVSVGTLNPEFNPDKNYYEVSVDKDITSIDITAIKEDEFASVVGTGTKNLKSGRNVFQITVTNQDKSRTNTYTVAITREKSNDATLKSLSVEGQNFYPSFTKNEENYTMYVSSDVENLNISAIPTEDESTVKITGNKNLSALENKVLIEVTAPDGITKKTYTITVNKAKSSNNYLTDLSVLDYTFDRPFTKTDQGPYVITVLNDVNNISINAIKEDEKAKISGDGIITLNPNQNVLSIIVTAENGDTRTYTIIVNKITSNDATLKEILLSEGSLSPEFNKDLKEYTISVSEEVEQITVTGIPSNNKAVVTGNKEYSLTDAETIVLLEVTAEDGTKNTYKLTIKKDDSESAKIQDLIVKNGELSPTFDKLLTDYTVLIPNEVEKLDMLITLEDKDATYEITGNEDFIVGTNTVSIKVTSKNKKVTETYTINAIRQIEADNYLDNLEVEGYTLKPVFDSTTLYYEVTVPNSINSVNIIAEASELTSSVTGTGVKNLSKDKETFYITVTSIDGIIRTYQVVINKEKLTDNYLLSLIPSIGTLDKTFDKNVNEYTLNIPTGTNEVTFSGTISDGATSTGLDTKVNISELNTTHKIVVTNEEGNSNTYTITINKGASTNTKLVSLIPSAGSLDYSNDTLEYEMEVEDEVSILSFIATPEDANATVTKDEFTSLNYGENEIKIIVTAEDGITTREITIKVNRKKNLTSIIPSKDKVLLDISDEEVITYTLDPTDTTFTEVEWKSLDENIATVDETGKITAIGYGSTSIQIISKDNPNIYATVIVNVVSKKILSDNYTINHEAETPYVVGAEPSIDIEEFLSNFKNNRDYLHVFLQDNEELKTSDVYIGTKMILKLIIDEVEYDSLTIIVRGDLDGDGEVLVNDYVKVKNFLLNKLAFDFIENKAVDLDNDDEVLVNDYVKMKNYLLNKISTLN